MLDQELEVSFRARRNAYVIDPLLALASAHGAQLVSRLSTVADVWVTRTFWQVIDASDYYHNDPLNFWPQVLHVQLSQNTASDFKHALMLWEEVRQRSDMSHCRLNWASDNLTESVFPDGTPPDLIARYEMLHQSLTSRSNPNNESIENAGFYGAIDSLCLAAALGNARVLSTAPTSSVSCLMLACQQAGLQLESLEGQNPPNTLLSIERQRFQELIVSAGCSALIWAGLRPAIIHPVLSADLILRVEQAELHTVECLSIDAMLDDYSDDQQTLPVLPSNDPWLAARNFWYSI